jgi:hypothetical protein
MCVCVRLYFKVVKIIVWEILLGLRPVIARENELPALLHNNWRICKQNCHFSLLMWY